MHTIMYLICLPKQIFSIFTLQKSFILLVYMAQRWMQVPRLSMFIQGESSMITLEASEKALRIDLSSVGQKSSTFMSLWKLRLFSARLGCRTTTSMLFLSILRNYPSTNSILGSTSQTLALFSKKPILFLFYSLAITFTHEFTLANLIALPPTPAKASRIILAPLHLFAMYYDTCQGGFTVHDFSSILMPSSNFSKCTYLWSQYLLNSKLPYLFCSMFQFFFFFFWLISLLSRESLMLILVVDILMSISLFLEPAGKSICSVRLDMGQSSSSSLRLFLDYKLKDSLNQQSTVFIFLRRLYFLWLSSNYKLFLRLVFLLGTIIQSKVCLYLQ